MDDIVNTQAIIRGHHAGLQLLAANVGNAAVLPGFGLFPVDVRGLGFFGGVGQAQFAINCGTLAVAHHPAAAIPVGAQQHRAVHGFRQRQKEAVLAVIHTKVAAGLILRGKIPPQDKAQPLVHSGGNFAAVIDHRGNLDRSVAVQIGADQCGVIPQGRFSQVGHARRAVGLQKSGFRVIHYNRTCQAGAGSTGPAIHHQIVAIVRTNARVQGRTAAVITNRKGLGGAEAILGVGQQLQVQAAALLLSRQGQYQILGALSARQVGKDHFGVCLLDDDLQAILGVQIHHHITVALGAGIADKDLQGIFIPQMGGVHAFHLAGKPFCRLRHPPAVFLGRFQNSQVHIARRGIQRVQHGGFILAVTIPIAKQKRGKKISAGRVFQGRGYTKGAVERLLYGARLAGSLRRAQQGFHIAAGYGRTAGKQQRGCQCARGAAAAVWHGYFPSPAWFPGTICTPDKYRL